MGGGDGTGGTGRSLISRWIEDAFLIFFFLGGGKVVNVYSSSVHECKKHGDVFIRNSFHGRMDRLVLSCAAFVCTSAAANYTYLSTST